jgi:hypothetical protein
MQTKTPAPPTLLYLIPPPQHTAPLSPLATTNDDSWQHVLSYLQSQENNKGENGWQRFSPIAAGIVVVVTVAGCVYVFRSRVRGFLSSEGAAVTTETIKAPHLRDEITELSKTVVSAALTDNDVMRQARAFAKQLLETAETRAALAALVRHTLEGEF